MAINGFSSGNVPVQAFQSSPYPRGSRQRHSSFLQGPEPFHLRKMAPDLCQKFCPDSSKSVAGTQEGSIKYTSRSSFCADCIINRIPAVPATLAISWGSVITAWCHVEQQPVQTPLGRSWSFQCGYVRLKSRTHIGPISFSVIPS